jgi:hypothetical protein
MVSHLRAGKHETNIRSGDVGAGSARRAHISTGRQRPRSRFQKRAPHLNFASQPPAHSAWLEGEQVLSLAAGAQEKERRAWIDNESRAKMKVQSFNLRHFASFPIVITDFLEWRHGKINQIW